MHTLIQEKKTNLMNRTIWKSRQGPLGIEFCIGIDIGIQTLSITQ